MKRRNFMKQGAVAALGMGLTGCSAIKPKKINFKKANKFNVSKSQ